MLPSARLQVSVRKQTCVDRITVRDFTSKGLSRYLSGFVANESKISLPVSSEARHPTAARDWFFSNVYSSMFMENQLYDQRLFSTFPSLEGLLGLNKNYKKTALFTATLYAFSSLLDCLLASLRFRFSPFQGDLIRFFCALTKFEMQRTPSLRKTRVRLSARARHLGTHALLMERNKNQVKMGGRLAPKPPALHALSKSTRKTNSYRSISDLAVVVVLLILYSYPRVASVILCACIRILFLCLTCCHGAAVAACCASCFFDGDPCWCDAHSLPLPRRWSPAAGSALSLDVQEVQCRTVSQPGHRKTPEARTTATVAATEVTAAQRICYGRQSPPSTSHSCSLSRALSLRFCNALALSLFNTPLFRSCIRSHVTESPNRPSSVAWHVGDTTTLSGQSGVSASSLSPSSRSPSSPSSISLFFNLSVISARIVIQNLVTLSLGTNPYQELAESSH